MTGNTRKHSLRRPSFFRDSKVTINFSSNSGVKQSLVFCNKDGIKYKKNSHYNIMYNPYLSSAVDYSTKGSGAWANN